MFLLLWDAQCIYMGVVWQLFWCLYHLMGLVIWKQLMYASQKHVDKWCPRRNQASHHWPSGCKREYAPPPPIPYVYPYKTVRQIKVAISNHHVDYLFYLWLDIWPCNCKKINYVVWSYMTPNSFTETRCYWTRQTKQLKLAWWTLADSQLTMEMPEDVRGYIRIHRDFSDLRTLCSIDHTLYSKMVLSRGKLFSLTKWSC